MLRRRRLRPLGAGARAGVDWGKRCLFRTLMGKEDGVWRSRTSKLAGST